MQFWKKDTPPSDEDEAAAGWRCCGTGGGCYDAPCAFGVVHWGDWVTQLKLVFTFLLFFVTPLTLILVYTVGSGDGASSSSPSSGLAADAREFLDVHNEFRAKHCGIPLLEWSDEVEASAKVAARTCTFAHGMSGAVGAGYGENLCMGHATITACVTAWYDEIDDVTDWSNPENNPTGVIGHFTQMVWDESLRLGCAICESQRIYVCQYDPPGNYIGSYGDHVHEPSTCPAGAGGADGEELGAVAITFIVLGCLALVAALAWIAASIFGPESWDMAGKNEAIGKALYSGLRYMHWKLRSLCFFCWTGTYSPCGIFWMEDTTKDSVYFLCDAAASADASGRDATLSNLALLMSVRLAERAANAHTTAAAPPRV